VTSRVRLRVHPGGRRERIEGFRADGALAIEVTAAAEGGKANVAVVKLVSRVLGVPRAAISIAGGSASRSKWIEVDGLTLADIRARIAAAIGSSEASLGE
jgi:uncharacterized protein YggU (UPF0235/DUF167 family)